MKETKKFILAMPENLHKEVKIVATLNNNTMTDFINAAIREKLAKAEKTKTIAK